MAYEDLIPGSYDAKLQDWDLVMVEKAKTPKLVLDFEFQHEMKTYKMKFETFVMKKDGTVSKKYLDTLKACGFKGSKTTDLFDDKEALNTSQVYSIDCQKDNNTGYWKVEWVNSPQAFGDKVQSKKKLQGFDFSKIDGALMQAGISQPKMIKNFAPVPPVIDDNDEIPF